MCVQSEGIDDNVEEEREVRGSGEKEKLCVRGKRKELYRRDRKME